MKLQKCNNRTSQKKCNYFGNSFDKKTIFNLFKQSGLTIEAIADKLCISYDTCRNQIYSKRLSPKLWIRYYQLFLNYIKK